MPRLVILAGPNGAGKSTSAKHLLQGPRAVAEFVNADDIEAKLAPRSFGRAAFAAGTQVLRRIGRLSAALKDFAMESTLSGRSLHGKLESFKTAGYEIHLIYLWLPSADLAVARVAERVRAGGHSVPEDVVRRRYARSLRNFFNLYRPVADSWLMLDNSLVPPRPIAWRGSGGLLQIVRDGPWEALRKQYEQDPIRS
jgi:predicted ABC-type ATPase